MALVADVRCAPEVHRLRQYKPTLSVSQLGVLQLAVPGTASSRYSNASRPLGGLCLGALASAALTSHRRRNCRRDRTRSMALEAEDDSSEVASCGICGVFGGERRGMLQAGLLLSLPSPSAAEQLQIQGGSVNCINCNGEGYLTCYRCKGTKKMRWLEEETPQAELKDCIECDATGYVPCGRCQATGLSAAKLKSYNRDEKFRKIVARTRKIKCDDDGRAKLKRVMAAAIAEVEAKTAVSEGREAQEVRPPEAPKEEPKGTWIGS